MDHTINELLHRNPEDGFSEEELDRLIAHFREQREKWKASGENGRAMRKKKPAIRLPNDEVSKLLGE